MTQTVPTGAPGAATRTAPTGAPKAATRRSTRLAFLALPALLAAQVLAAQETAQALSSSPSAQAAQGLEAATKLFGADPGDTSAPASTDPATPAETAPGADQAAASVPTSVETPGTEEKAEPKTPEAAPDGPSGPDAGSGGSDLSAGSDPIVGSDTKQDMSQAAAATATPASDPAATTEPAMNVPVNAGSLPTIGSLPSQSPLGSLPASGSFGSLPRVRSMAEGQAQRTRAAAAQVAAQESFVSVGPALRVEMVYGQSWPTLVCKYNLTCLLELEPGEVIADTQILADSVRWEAALRYREHPEPQAYIAFKPRPDAQETNFILLTDRRVYSILLIPDPVVHTPILSFSYPDTEAADMVRRIEAQRQGERTRTAAARAAATATRQAAVRQSGVPTVRGAVPADELDFNYRITGRAPFKPVRIYTDGQRTYIDLPARYRGELPVLLASSANTNSAINITVGRNGTQLIADKDLTAFALVVGRQRIQVRKGR